MEKLQSARIRPFCLEDTEAVRKICVKTDHSFTEEQTPLLLCLYCDYYIQQEPENCFVVADEQDQAVGYVLTAQNWERYCERYREIYLPKLQKLDSGFYQEKKEEMKSESQVYRDYPAHLHIDILPGFQSMGYGPKLLQAAFENLRGKGAPGIMLGVGKANRNAVRFYQRVGFSLLEEKPTCYHYGMRL